MGKDHGAMGSMRDSRTEEGRRMGGYRTFFSRGLIVSGGGDVSVSHESSVLRSSAAIGLIMWSEVLLGYGLVDVSGSSAAPPSSSSDSQSRAMPVKAV